MKVETPLLNPRLQWLDIIYLKGNIKYHLQDRFIFAHEST